MARAGAVWLDVLPSMSSWNKSVKAQAKVSLSGVGKEAGTSYATGLKGALLKGLSGTGATLKAELESGAKEAAAAVSQAEGKIAAARKAQADAAGKLRVAEAKLQETRDKAGAAASSVAAAEERVAAAERNSQLAAQKAAAASKELEVAQGEAAAANDAAAASGGRFSSGLGKVSKGLGGMGSKIGGVTKGIASMGGLFAGIEVAKFGADSIKSAQDFQQSTNVLVTAAGESTKNLKTIRSGIEDISTSTGTDLDNLTKGMYVVEKAGYRGANGLKVLGVAAQGAREEGAQLDTVTNAMTSVMASYHISASKSVNVMNAMKTAAGESKTTMEAFAGSLSTVLPVASANGISFASVAGALATLTQHGTTANEATQELSNTIRNLSAPNNVASKEMAQFGISSNSVSRNLGKRGLTGTLDLLSQTVLKKMGPSGLVLLKSFNQSKAAAQDALTMYSALEKKAPNVVSSLGKGVVNIGTSIDPVKMGFSKFLTGLKDGTVSTADYRNAIKSLSPIMAKQVSQYESTLTNAKGFNQQLKLGIPGSETYTAAIKKMTGGANGLNTTLQLTGESLAGTKTRTDAVAKSFADGGKSVEGWKSTQKLFSVQMDRLKNTFKVAGMDLATGLLPSLTSAAKVMANGALSAVKFAKANKGWLGPLAAGLGIAAGALVGLSVAMAIFNVVADANPVVLIIVGIVALAAALVIAYKKVGWFRAAVQDVGKAAVVVGKALKTAFVASLNWFTGSFLPFFTKTLPGAFSAVKNWFTSTWSTVSTAVISPFKSAWDWLAGPFAGFFTTTLPGFFKGAASTIASPFKTAFAVSTNAVKTGWIAITAAFSASLKWITATFGPAFHVVSTLIETPIRLAIRLVQVAWARLKAPFTAAAKWVGTTFKNAWQRDVAFIASVVRAVVKPVTTAWGAVTGAFTTAKNWVGGTFKKAWKINVAVVSAVVQATVTPVKKGWTAITGAFTASKDWVGNTFKKAWKVAVAVVGTVVQAVTTPVKKGWAAVTGTFTSAKNWVTGTWSRTWSAVKAKMTGPISDAKSAIAGFLGREKHGLQWEFQSAVTAIGKIWDGLKSVAKAPIRFIVETVLNNGLIAGFNKIAQFAWGNSKHNIGKIPLPQGFQSGGYTGDGPTSKVAGVTHAREVVFDEPAVRAAGGPHRLDRFRRGLKSGAARLMPGYQSGGIVRPVANSIGLAQGIHDVGAMGPNSSAVDFAAPTGTPVVAGAAGKVTKSYDIRGYEPRRVGPQDGYRSYGRVIEIASQGFNTLYAHLSKRIAGAGAVVKAGQEIGVSGNTGNTTGPHLHFGAQDISPMAFVNAGYNASGVASGGGLLSSIVGAGKNIWGKVKGAVSDPLSLLQAAISHGISGVMKFGNSNLVQTIAQIPKKLISDAGSALVGKIDGFLGLGNTGSSGVSGNAQEVIHSMMLQRWPESQWAPLKTLIQNESSWNDRNRNPSSGAFGLFQLLGANFAALHGNYSDQNQGKVGLGYIDTRYGSPANALAQWMNRDPHWYDNGGIMPPGLSLSYNGTGRGEHQAMFTDRQWAALTQIAERPGGDTIIIQGVADKAGAAREIEQLLLSHGRSVSGVRTVRKNS